MLAPSGRGNPAIFFASPDLPFLCRACASVGLVTNYRPTSNAWSAWCRLGITAAIQVRPPINEDILAGNWKRLKRRIQAQWGELPGDDMQIAEGNTDYLVGKLQARYGWDRDRARTEVSDFGRRVGNDHHC